MRKIDMILVVLLTAVFAGITQVNAAANSPVPVTHINTGLSRLTAAIDQKADKYMLSETTGNIKGEIDEFVNGVKTDIENASKKSGLEFGKIVVPVVQTYEKRIMDAAPQIMDCSKSTWPTDNCVTEILNYDKNKVIVTALTLAIINHYLVDPLKEFRLDGDDNSVRKLIEQELESKRNPAK